MSKSISKETDDKRQEILKKYFNKLMPRVNSEVNAAIKYSRKGVLIICQNIDEIDTSKMQIKETDSAFVELKKELMETGTVSDVQCHSAANLRKPHIFINLKT